MSTFQIPDHKPYLKWFLKKKNVDNIDVVISDIMKEYAADCMKALLEDPSIRIDKFEDYLDIKTKIDKFVSQ